MMELWRTIDPTTKIVVAVSTLTILIGIVGFLWFMISHGKRK